MFLNEDLISLVKNRPEVWNQSHPDYSQKSIKALAWNAIAKKMHARVDIIKTRWTNLRDLFRRELKKTLKKAKDTGDVEAYVPRWKHFKHMLFLKDMMTKSEGASVPHLNTEQVVVAYPQSTFAEDEEVDVVDVEGIDCFKEENCSSPSPSPTEKTAGYEISRKRYAPSTSVNNDSYLKRPRNDDSDYMYAGGEYSRTSSGGYNELDEDYHFIMSILPSLRRIRQERKTTFKMRVLQLIIEEEQCCID